MTNIQKSIDDKNHQLNIIIIMSIIVYISVAILVSSIGFLVTREVIFGLFAVVSFAYIAFHSWLMIVYLFASKISNERPSMFFVVALFVMLFFVAALYFGLYGIFDLTENETLIELGDLFGLIWYLGFIYLCISFSKMIIKIEIKRLNKKSSFIFLSVVMMFFILLSFPYLDFRVRRVVSAGEVKGVKG